MKTTKILSEDIADMRVSSLPSRPSAPTAFGGRGYTADEVKEAFDRLPLYIVEKFNSLIDDVRAVGGDSLAAAMPTGFYDGHTLADLLEDVKNGNLAAYLTVGDASLSMRIAALEARLDALEGEE